MATWSTGPEDGKGFGTRRDYSTDPGIQTEMPKAPEAVRLAYLLEGIADEFRALEAAALDDGKDDVLIATTCKLELGVTWTREGEASVKFWVLEIGAGVSQERSQKVTVEMSLSPAVPLIATTTEDGTLSPADVTDWASEASSISTEDAIRTDGGRLQLAFILERLADEFRHAKAGAANKKAILRYDKVTLELSGATETSATGGAKFWVLDIAGGGSQKRTETITVDMTPVGLGELSAGGIVFVN